MTRIRRRGFVLCGLAVLVAVPATALTVYVAEDGKAVGPFDTAAIKARLGSQEQAGKTLVWMQGMADWAPADQVPALAALVASLPLVPPFEPAKYLIGSWRSDDQPIKVGKTAIMGQILYTFSADGSATFQSSGSRITITTKPGPKPGETQTISESLILNDAFSGTYSVGPSEDGFFLIKMKGKLTDLSGNADEKPLDWRESLELRQAGPNHLRSRYGVNYYKTDG